MPKECNNIFSLSNIKIFCISLYCILVNGISVRFRLLVGQNLGPLETGIDIFFYFLTFHRLSCSRTHSKYQKQSDNDVLNIVVTLALADQV